MSSSPRVKSLVLGVLAIWLLSQACSLIPKRVTQPNIYQEPEVESSTTLFADFEEDLLDDIQREIKNHTSGT